MRLLFELDAGNYDPDAPAIVRPSVRGILLRDGRVAMVHSAKYDYYKFPGGGIESGERHEQTLIREVLEEAGLVVLPQSIQAYGYVHRAQKSREGGRFLQDNFYYFFQAAPTRQAQQLDAYEAEEGFHLVFVSPAEAIRANRQSANSAEYPAMLEREARVLELLQAEGYL